MEQSRLGKTVSIIPYPPPPKTEHQVYSAKGVDVLDKAQLRTNDIATWRDASVKSCTQVARAIRSVMLYVECKGASDVLLILI